MTPRPAAGRSSAALLAVLALGAAGVVAFLALGGSPPPPPDLESAPLPDEPPRAPSRPASDEPPAAPRSGRALEREGLESRDEDFASVPTPEHLREAFVRIDPADRDAEHAVVASGEALRQALLAVPGLYLRFQDEDVRRRFLGARHRLPPDAATEEGGQGAPLALIVSFLDESEDFAAKLRPPVLWIGAQEAAPR